ncbi:RES family NAD+ phosphorylase [Geminocystis sp. GBBB08]|uniref:RES family NAD+ phosphorylase n=1 Tax=Geminocystis sp. GBBB08 TaxID=2604140 RepID=UPI0027E2B422|nr:RES family NAD+ phosphorylase [Geminocystis sp. GBBB08]MBL1210485.1 RES family NAD+ phosphorylase [Geminocystis sp. GBBB08]
MVVIAQPPPKNKPNPLFYHLPTNTELIRIFDPTTKYKTQALTFRCFGPLHRFDHHSSDGKKPQLNTDRGIYYTAFTLSSCIVEYFGDSGVIDIQEQCVAIVQSTRSLLLLDIRGSGAMRAGSVSALAKTADRELSQAWSRYFYKNEHIYRKIDGIIYFNAHNDEEAIALYERAENAVSCDSNQIIKLDDIRLRSHIQKIALDNNLIFIP